MTISPENQQEPRVPLSYKDMESSSHFAVGPPKWLFHYTSLSSASQILYSKSLWLTKIQYLNDTSELKIAFDLFKNAVELRLKELITNETEKSKFLLLAKSQIDSFKQTNLCVASFCENGDLLSQWRAYGSGGLGVALGFSGKRLEELQNTGFTNIWKCIYRPEIQERVANDLVKILEKSFDVCYQNKNPNNWEKTKEDLIGHFNTTFLKVAPVLKDRHFEEEKEWRLVTTPMKNTNTNYHPIITDKRVSQVYIVNFETSRTQKHDFIGTMTIGPTANPEQIGDTFQIASSQLAYEPILFEKSKIPFRGS